MWNAKPNQGELPAVAGRNRPTSRFIRLVAMAMLVITTGGCDEHEHHDDSVLVQMSSDQAADATVILDPVTSQFAIGSAVSDMQVSYGLKEDEQNVPEYRGFLDFPLDGSIGGGVVLPDAEVLKATLEIYVESVDFTTSVPTLLEVVPYPLSGPTSTDFDTPALATLNFDVFRSDEGLFLDIDVTSAVQLVIDEGLLDFQARVSLDTAVSQGFVQIADDGISHAPILAVSYR